MSIILHRKFVCADAENNNNKFWEVILDDVNQATIKFGRVGATASIKTKTMTLAQVEKEIKEKTKPGRKNGSYTEIEIVAESISKPSTANVVNTAVRDIAGQNNILIDLVSLLAEANRHELNIASGGQMQINTSGLVTTPLGVVKQENIDEARTILSNMEQDILNKNFDSSDFIANLNQYLRLVPQKVSASRGWHKTFIPNIDAMQRQNTLLDQLESSVKMATSQINSEVVIDERVFEVTLELIDNNTQEFKDIQEFYKTGHQTRHSAVSHLKPKRAFRVVIPHMKQAYDACKIGNEKRLWHGTRVFNVLSILKNGLIIPKGGSYHITGRMFGDGVYFSDQSTKSLNYATNFWSGGKNDSLTFMFLCDVKMGKEYIPTGPFSGNAPAGFDSTYAIGGKSQVLNNEMIVYSLDQCNITHLVEFE